MVRKSPIFGAGLFGAVVVMVPALLAADNKACKLLTPAELEPVVGGKLSAFQGQSTGTTDMCSATSTNAKVLLRLAQKKGGASADAAAKGLEIAKKMGATVDVKTFGPIVCSSFIPPKGKEMAGYNTTCTVSKGDAVAGVEVTVKAQKDIVSIDKLRPLADKMAGRF
jgi:hypothetical protein